MKEYYDIIVIGAGHAGVEAAFIASKLVEKVLLLTLNLDIIAWTPCNPSIGGPGKGHLVAEIDALGGLMGKITDSAYVQMRTLMTSRGRTARALRAQIDKKIYSHNARIFLESIPNLVIKQEMATDIKVENGKVKAVITEFGNEYECKAAILTGGTFLNSKIVLGQLTWNSGPHEERTCSTLSRKLKKLGIEVDRFQTATPPRVNGRSIDFSVMKPLEGETGIRGFSWGTIIDRENQIPSFLTYTSKKTVDFMKQALKYSPLMLGNITDRGPRFCPSIDRKVINFPEKYDHQIFVEPEGFQTDEWYLQGLTTSLPPQIQLELLKTVKGLENAEIMRFGYAIEYDYFPPRQIYPTMESKIVEGLYFAGQVNGTSGYEEAAAQGLIAGINAALKILGKPEFVLTRYSSYIGVLIDDITRKEFFEPYRLYTSRVEYRMLLRQSMAHFRLSLMAKNLGLIDENTYNEISNLKKKMDFYVAKIKNTFVTPNKKTNEILRKIGTANIKTKISLADLLNRSDVKIYDLKHFGINFDDIPNWLVEEIETEIKYEGYILKQLAEIEKMEKIRKVKIPQDIDYNNIPSLSVEAKDELLRTKPKNLAQVMENARVSQEDLFVLYKYIKKREGK